MPYDTRIGDYCPVNGCEWDGDGWVSAHIRNNHNAKEVLGK